MREPLGPLSAVDLAALVRLCNLKKVIQRDDGYGTESETLISRASAVMLKKRNLAVTGWSRESFSRFARSSKMGQAPFGLYFAIYSVGLPPALGTGR